MRVYAIPRWGALTSDYKDAMFDFEKAQRWYTESRSHQICLSTAIPQCEGKGYIIYLLERGLSTASYGVDTSKYTVGQ